MKTLGMALGLALAAGTAAAQAGLRDSDIRLSQAELSAELAGQVVEFYDQSQAFYEAGGGYRYVYAPGDPPFVGTYAVTDDSAVCVTFDNGFSRCDTYVQAGERLVLIVENGDRYPVKSRAAIE